MMKMKTLENTLFIPSYPQRNISVQVATRNGARVNFDGSTAELITKSLTFWLLLHILPMNLSLI